MGIFAKYFGKKNLDEYCLNKEQILSLISISMNIFDKERRKFEIQKFHTNIIDWEIPEEYQQERITLENEFKKRFKLSSGIISIAIFHYLIKKKMGNSHNVELMNSILRLLFSNLIKMRTEILSGPKIEDWHFYDTENLIIETNETFESFSKRISLLSNDIKSFVEDGGRLNAVRNYLGIRIGQIIPEVLDEKDEELGDLLKETIRKILQNFEMYFFDLI